MSSFLPYENIDPLLGSLTALECALDGYNKLSRMAEEIFGGGIFCSGKQKQRENKTGEEVTIVNTRKDCCCLFSKNCFDTVL